LPYSEASDLLDYVQLATTMSANASIKFDRLPRNLKKAHAILSTNNVILTNPRPEEFKMAVDQYSGFVNWIPSDETNPYIFKAPIDELPLK
jgi:hypothetical protein